MGIFEGYGIRKERSARQAMCPVAGIGKKEENLGEESWEIQELKLLLSLIMHFHCLQHGIDLFCRCRSALYIFFLSFSHCIEHLLSSFNFCGTTVLKTISCCQMIHPRSFFWLFLSFVPFLLVPVHWLCSASCLFTEYKLFSAGMLNLSELCKKYGCQNLANLAVVTLYSG